MKYIVQSKDVYGAIWQLARALYEKNFRCVDFERWEIGKKIYRISEPTECRVIEISKNVNPVLMYEYEIEEEDCDEFCEDGQWTAEQILWNKQNASMILSKFKQLKEDIMNEQLPDMPEDLASKNQTDAQTQYGRLYRKTSEREEALKDQIERLINCGYRLADAVHQNNGNLHHWAYEVELARELIK